MTNNTKIKKNSTNLIKNVINDNKKVDLQSDPHDFDYEPNAKLRSLINEAIHVSVSNDCSRKDIIQEAQMNLQNLLQIEQKDHIKFTYDQLEQVHKYLQRVLSSYELYFYQCIELCRPINKLQTKNKELSKRLKELKCKQSQAYYKQLTESVIRNRGDIQISQVASDFRDVNSSLIAIGNGLLVIAGTFVFVYKAVEYSLLTPDIPLQVMAAFLTSLVVAVAEFYWIFKII